jgi:hypothetical protein
MLHRGLIALFLGIALSSCGHPQMDTIDLQSQDPGNRPEDTPDDPPSPPPPPTPNPIPSPDAFPTGWTAAWSDTRRPERQAWTDHTYKQTQEIAVTALAKEFADAKEFCPSFSKLNLRDRRAFLTVLLSAMAKYESNFNPQSKFEENFNDNNGNPVISRGLLQLSVESSNSYECKVTSRSLHDANTNLSCGLRIISRWMSRDKRIGSTVSGDHLGGARYWSVLRGSSNSRPKIISYMRNQPKCK